MSKEPSQLSIGALSRATGVPTETLRTWERRYGFPASKRTHSGHRRYPMATIDRLRLVLRAMELGHRPADALAADERSLRQLLVLADGASGAEPVGGGPAPARDGDSKVAAERLERWFEHVERYEGRALDRELRATWNELGARDFAQHCVSPFLIELGDRWASGRLGVRHEHFASERLREFLAGQWRPISDAATGPIYVLATLPGERHVLGLHLVALCVVLAGGRVVFLGVDLPPGEIAAAADHHHAEAVLVSTAAGSERAPVEGALRELRQNLPASTALVIGGQGAAGVRTRLPVFLDLSHFEVWLAQRGDRQPR
ncbi:MAG: MerR family transcriptional regulator [Myxococcales bacterium]|nr:MerR family transcriptional regulator [Myxococcales bacterium]